MVEEAILSESRGVSLHWCGRGTTALTWAFKAAAMAHPAISKPEVVLPATACSTMPAAGILANCRLRFVDVRLEDALMDLDKLPAALSPNTVAVLFIHLYGNTADLEALYQTLSSRKIWLIEDAAQAFGGRTPSGKSLGSIGDLAIHGFSDNKILDAGGGALMVRNPACQPTVNEAIRLIQPWKSVSKETYRRYDQSFQFIYSGLVELQRISPESRPHAAFRDIIRQFGESFIQAHTPKPTLPHEWSSLKTNIAHRLEMAEIYHRMIPSEIATPICIPEESGIVWKWTMLLSEGISQQSVIGALRRKGFLPTDLYWPLDALLSEEPSCPNAMEIGRRVVNLPVDGGVNREMVEAMANVIRSAERGA